MHILHNTIINRWKIARNPAKTPHTRKNENRRHRIRNRIPRRPTTSSRRPHTRHSHRTHENRQLHRAPATATTRRNMQRRNPKTLGRKLVLRATRFKRSPQRNGTQRLPLRPHSRSPRTNRFGQRRNPYASRKTATIPIRTEATATGIMPGAESLKFSWSRRRFIQLICQAMKSQEYEISV